MTCCGGTFLVVALLAMGCSLSALWLPLVVVAPEDGTSFPSSGSGSGFNGGSGSGSHASSYPNNGGSSSNHASSYPNNGGSSSNHASSYPNNGGSSSNHASSYPNNGGSSSNHASSYPSSNNGDSSYPNNGGSSYPNNGGSSYPSSNNGDSSFPNNGGSSYPNNGGSSSYPNNGGSSYPSSNNGGSTANGNGGSTANGNGGSTANGASTFKSDNKHSLLAMLGARAHVSSSTKKQRSFKQQELSGLPEGSFQCPFFNNHCYFGSMRMDADGSALRTDDVVVMAGCDSLGVLGNDLKTRFWALMAAACSCATVLVAICHARRGNNFGSYAALIKFGAAGCAAAHVGACGIVFILQSPITNCLQDYVTSVYDNLPGTYIIVMISLLMNCAAAGINFLNGIGMVLSYCTSCCGSPAGRHSQASQLILVGQPLNTHDGRSLDGQPLMSPFEAQQAYDTYSREQIRNIQQSSPAPGYPVKY